MSKNKIHCLYWNLSNFSLKWFHFMKLFSWFLELVLFLANIQKKSFLVNILEKMSKKLILNISRWAWAGPTFKYLYYIYPLWQISLFSDFSPLCIWKDYGREKICGYYMYMTYVRGRAKHEKDLTRPLQHEI